jgi:Mg/Co/Ni transporter MgtE
VTAPVLDPDNRLVGVITVDDVVDVIAEEADEEIKALGGITSDEELSDSIWTIARGRFNWLLVNLATALLAASVLGLFKGHRKDGGARGAGADRGEPGRQRSNPDHDGCGPRTGDA